VSTSVGAWPRALPTDHGAAFRKLLGESLQLKATAQVSRDIVVTDVGFVLDNRAREVEMLNQANTLGASAGAFASGVLLFMVLPLDRVIQLAALGNFTVAALAFFRVRTTS